MRLQRHPLPQDAGHQGFRKTPAMRLQRTSAAARQRIALHLKKRSTAAPAQASSTSSIAGPAFHKAPRHHAGKPKQARLRAPHSPEAPMAGATAPSLFQLFDIGKTEGVTWTSRNRIGWKESKRSDKRIRMRTAATRAVVAMAGGVEAPESATASGGGLP